MDIRIVNTTGIPRDTKIINVATGEILQYVSDLELDYLNPSSPHIVATLKIIFPFTDIYVNHVKWQTWCPKCGCELVGKDRDDIPSDRDRS